jgi:23S rRNA pseudouridine1911/1915/1917 synthase
MKNSPIHPFLIPPEVLLVFENDDFLVLNKPAGLVTHPTKQGPYSSLVSRVRIYLGGVENLHMVHRLDRETGGLIVFAKNSPAASSIGRIWMEGLVSKEYLAIVHGRFPFDEKSVALFLGKDLNSPIAVKDTVCSSGDFSETKFYLLKHFQRSNEQFSLLRVIPKTGRKHQIRIHLRHLGFPIVGDKLYGKSEEFYQKFVASVLTMEDLDALMLPFQALHACGLQFTLRRKEFCFFAGPESWFGEFAQE